MSALVTEHFVLQSAASTTVSEAFGRCSLYLSALSSSLIALGFAAQTPGLLIPFAAAVLPTVFVLGVFSTVRLVGTGVQNVRCLTEIARIRDYYKTLGPDGPRFFSPTGLGSQTDQALHSMAVTPGALAGLFTTASMIATINAVLGGVGTGLAVNHLVDGPTWPAVPVGALVGGTCLVIFFRYQHRSYTTAAAAGESANSR